MKKCQHRGACTNDRVDLRCPGKPLVVLVVYKCSEFGECLPAYRCNKSAISEWMSRDVAVCWGCESFSAVPPDMPPEQEAKG